jgi:hypothetical protein
MRTNDESRHHEPWPRAGGTNLDFDRYSPLDWEQWCHAANFGRVHGWDKGQERRSVRFAPVTHCTSRHRPGGARGEHRAGRNDERTTRQQPNQPLDGAYLALAKLLLVRPRGPSKHR